MLRLSLSSAQPIPMAVSGSSSFLALWLVLCPMGSHLGLCDQCPISGSDDDDVVLELLCLTDYRVINQPGRVNMRNAWSASVSTSDI